MDTCLKDVVLVHDPKNAASLALFEQCKEVRPPLMGVEDCSLSGRNKDLCSEMGQGKTFPALCHVEKGTCVYGVTDAREIGEQLCRRFAEGR